MVDDRGQIAIDFLLGISLFLIALIFTVQFIPGMSMAGSAREGSLDYTAYRTATILVEDTGWWGNNTSSGTDWESHPTDNIERIGLAVDDDPTSRLTNSPNILSKNKTTQLMLLNENDLTETLGLYNQVDNTHFSYGYNISITKNNAPLVLNNTPVLLGETVPYDRETSKITRIVLVETGTIADFSGEELPMKAANQEEYPLIDITGPLNEEVTLYISNFNITGGDPGFKKLRLDGAPLSEVSDYLAYKISPNGTIEIIGTTGKIDNDDVVAFVIYQGILTGSQTYQLEFQFKDIEFGPTSLPVPEYQDVLTTYYEPAYLTVEVWN
ncbi:hypothetical protein [Methanolobus sp.]|uniref:DUF7287 family protein n=1 Tax=Methanolobus sp. TaxID=1874737 RepID=UPI0025E0BD01|nr:hypothetical protein [Methanolobus sp.]